MSYGFLDEIRDYATILKEGTRRWINLPSEVRIVCVDHSFNAEEEKTTLYVEYYPDGVKHPDSHVQSWIVMRGLRHPLIDLCSSDLWLLGLRQNAAKNLADAAMAASVLWIVSPILLGVVVILRKQDQLLGMSRHSRALLDALGGQLSQTMETRLRRALENLWLGQFWPAEALQIPHL